jgi:glycosyltransferase involved in cell wall biosynthesis
MKLPKVSVVVPVFNSDESLEECAVSILNQTFFDFEIVFVNDGSTDDSVAVIEKLCAIDSRISIIHQENKGTGEARNAGIRQSQGEYICFVDSDDTIEPSMLSCLLSETSADVDVVVCDFHEVLESGRTHRHSFTGPFDFDSFFKAILSFQSASAVWAKLFHRNLFNHSACFFPTKLRNNEDNATLFKLLYFARNIRFVSEPLYNWKRILGSKSRDINELRLKETIDVLHQRKVFLLEQELFESYLAEYYTGVLYTLALRKSHIIKFAQTNKRYEYMQLLHASVLHSKLFEKSELLLFREMNIFDYWRIVFFSLDKVSETSSLGYEKYFEPSDWSYALSCSQHNVQPEIYSLNYYLQDYADQPIYIFGVGESWLELQKVLPLNIRVKGLIDKRFEGKCCEGRYDLNSALQIMDDNSVIVIASVAQAHDIFWRIKKHVLSQQRRPVVITFAGATHF